MQDEEFDTGKWFRQLLTLESNAIARHQGTSPEDYLYEMAESVRPAELPQWVYVTYEGLEYGPVRESWGPLDGDKAKMTALIYTKERLWVKCWYRIEE